MKYIYITSINKIKVKKKEQGRQGDRECVKEYFFFKKNSFNKDKEWSIIPTGNFKTENKPRKRGERIQKQSETRNHTVIYL